MFCMARICFMFGSSVKSQLELSVDWSFKDETHSVKESSEVQELWELHI